MSNITHLISKGEGKTIEFKKTLPQKGSLSRTAIAFSNTAGGKILIGVEDITGSAIAQVIEKDGLKGKVFGGGFDLVSDILMAIKDGRMHFTIDQQPYLQGFQNGMQLYLLKKFHQSTTDVNTGIAPVNAGNIGAVLELAEQGYR